MANPPGFHIDIVAPKIKIRDDRGRYTAAIAQLYAQSEEHMKVQQAQVGIRIQNNMVRKMVSTGRLLRVTADPKNVARVRTSEDQFTIGLGNEDFLNRSIAKYWRTIEEGSAATWTKRKFTTLPLQGIWGANLGLYRRIGNPWVGLGEGDNVTTGGGQEMYQPFRIGRGGMPSGLPIFTPKHEIRPMHAYKDVFENPDFSRRNLVIAQRFFNKVFADGFVHNPEGFYPGLPST